MIGMNNYNHFGYEYGTLGTMNTISTMPANTISIMPSFGFWGYDWEAPDYNGVFNLSPFVSGVGDLSFSDKNDRVYVSYGDFSTTNSNGDIVTSFIDLQDGSNQIELNENVIGVTVIGGDDRDHIVNARRANGGDGNDIIIADGINLSDDIRSWCWLSGDRGDDYFILKDTSGYGYIIGGEGEDVINCSLMSKEIIYFGDGDSLKADGTLGEDTVNLFYRGVDKIRLVSREHSIDYSDIDQTVHFDEFGEYYLKIRVEEMDVNVNIYTDDTSLDHLLPEDFLFA